MDLLSSSSEKNYARTFWRWLDKQSWRKMLPSQTECLVWFGVTLRLAGTHALFGWPRVSVILQDHSLESPAYLGSWHLLLPSDMTLVLKSGLTWACLCSCLVSEMVCLRFSSIYHYDYELFRSKFIGPEGASGSKYERIMFFFPACSAYGSWRAPLGNSWVLGFIWEHWMVPYPPCSQQTGCLAMMAWRWVMWDCDLMFPPFRMWTSCDASP